jgi:hypothetical protein
LRRRHSHGERAAAARANQKVVMARKDDGKRERAVEPLHCHCHCLLRCLQPLQIVRDQVGNDLGIGLGLEPVAVGNQLAAQFIKILDNTVMNNCDMVGRM